MSFLTNSVLSIFGRSVERPAPLPQDAELVVKLIWLDTKLKFDIFCFNDKAVKNAVKILSFTEAVISRPSPEFAAHLKQLHDSGANTKAVLRSKINVEIARDYGVFLIINKLFNSCTLDIVFDVRSDPKGNDRYKEYLEALDSKLENGSKNISLASMLLSSVVRNSHSYFDFPDNKLLELDPQIFNAIFSVVQSRAKGSSPVLGPIVDDLLYMAHRKDDPELLAFCVSMYSRSDDSDISVNMLVNEILKMHATHVQSEKNPRNALFRSYAEIVDGTLKAMQEAYMALKKIEKELESKHPGRMCPQEVSRILEERKVPSVASLSFDAKTKFQQAAADFHSKCNDDNAIIKAGGVASDYESRIKSWNSPALDGQRVVARM